MKFNVKEAVFRIFKDKNLAQKVFVIGVFVFIALVFGAVRMFFISELYFEYNDFGNRMYLVSTNFAPHCFLQYLGFPVVLSYLIPFDIMQLFMGGFDIIRFSGVFAVLIASCSISVVVGYFLYYMHNQVLIKESGLPDFKNIFSYFKKGIQYLFVCFSMLIPILVFNLILVKWIYSSFENYSNSDLDWLWAIIKPVLSVFSTSIIALVVFLFMSVMTLPYICTLQVKSLFKFKSAMFFILKNIKSYFKFLVHTLVFTLIFGVIVWLAETILQIIVELGIVDFNVGDFEMSYALSSISVSIVLILVIMPFLFWYISTFANLEAQFARFFLEKSKDEESN